MTGIDSWSVTPAENATADGGSINWAEGQAPSTVNNTARQMLTDVRNLANDSPWFQYGTGSQNTGTHLAVPAVYASGTSFTIAGADVTAAYHKGRRVRAVGVSTGTIYGTITASAFSTNTTVTVVWDSGSLSNETLVVSIGAPITGSPTQVHVAFSAYLNAATQSCADNTPTKVLLDAEEFDVGGFFDIATNYRFTPLVAGYYQFSWRVDMASLAAAGFVLASLYKNGSIFKRGNGLTQGSGATGTQDAVGSALVSMNGTTDYVELFVIQITGGSVNANGGDVTQTYLTGFLAVPAG